RVGTMDYDVVGNVMASSGETTDFGFVGMGNVRLDSTGLLFMKNRYYFCALGRFIQMDPIGIDAGDVCLYRYCANDGMNAIDPSGLWCPSSWHETLAIISTASFGVEVVCGGIALASAPTGVGAAVFGGIAVGAAIVGGLASVVDAGIYFFEGDNISGLMNLGATALGAGWGGMVLKKATAYGIKSTEKAVIETTEHNAAIFKKLNEEGPRVKTQAENFYKTFYDSVGKPSTGTRIDRYY
ncbi:MAG: RHS repeat-associated core domain-containing protein, partial [Victivallales bacterium]|nr:RHS repeat-associated core domain-containing protein [Victivallales bacterium]